MHVQEFVREVQPFRVVALKVEADVIRTASTDDNLTRCVDRYLQFMGKLNVLSRLDEMETKVDTIKRELRDNANRVTIGQIAFTIETYIRERIDRFASIGKLRHYRNSESATAKALFAAVRANFGGDGDDSLADFRDAANRMKQGRFPIAHMDVVNAATITFSELEALITDQSCAKVLRVLEAVCDDQEHPLRR